MKLWKLSLPDQDVWFTNWTEAKSYRFKSGDKKAPLTQEEVPTKKPDLVAWLNKAE